ncbi:MAG: pilus assembly protein N-terminal domain-containing protein [Reyranella sp.]|uniref:pilus assembly protein N-terminal domain-containing protein n=1 Tax=Reyranella sp. TaxID=1929291 RepID=UPI001AC1FFC6|nr:pilus assembly protein N-terminal domain-containing protein [Reyranella sp.]MBN9088980.1 pilus assembly protein N-terminal domain-containing protein [Reyranella sp.]
MKSFPLSTVRPPAWRRLGAALALAASMGFAMQTTLVMAQVGSEPDVPAAAPAKPKAKPAAKKHQSRTTPTDNVADELNRREAERIAKMTAGTAAASTDAKSAETKPADAKAADAKPQAQPQPQPQAQPAPTALPARAPVVTAAFTPTVAVPSPAQSASTPPAQLATPTPETVVPPAQIREAQARPVPVQPTPPGAAPAPSTVTGAAGRPFAQSQVVPPQQPTLTLEMNKGTAIKLPGAASTVFVAAPDIADVQVKSPSMIYVFAKRPGDTVLYAVDDQDRVLLNTIVSVTSPFSRVKATLDAMHPGNGVQFDNQGESIILSGTVRSTVIADDARRLALQHVSGNPAKLINNIRVEAPTQVQLRVKVAEVHREALKRLGVNWQSIANGTVGVAPLFGAVSSGFAVATAQSTGGLPSALARVSGGNFDALIDFLATNNQANVLAEPNLVAMSGETASFLAGGEIPVIAPQGGTLSGTFSVTYKSVGVSLAFTPTIVGERINLKVAPEVSQVSSVGSVSVPLTATATVTVPAVQTRRASTTVELGSGQSFAIAGLLMRTSQDDVKKMPWLGDVPVLGSLFKSDAYQRAETELVIICTPYFVEPTSDKLRTPMDRRVPPTDVDRLAMQRYNHPMPPQRLSVGREQYAGPSAGFRLD